MKYIILFLLPILSFAQSYEDYKRHLIAEEGCYNAAYYDSTGNKTIGIGHKVLAGEQLVYISDGEIDAIFQKDLKNAINGVERLVPNFDKQPKNIKIVLVSICFNVGHNGFYKFKKFREAIVKKDYKIAADEIENSLWARQVPKRAKRVIKILNKQ